MEGITGSSNVTLESVTVAAPSPPHTYLGVAENMIPGVQVLAEASPAADSALALVAAHVLECLLKAYLSKQGSDAALKNKDIRHNLEGLWAMAHSQGLQIPETPPDWVYRLSALHNQPYYLRYSTGIHGIVLLKVEPMASELPDLLRRVQASLGQ